MPHHTPQDQQTKICTKCGQKKSRDDFYRKPSGRDGLYSYCRECARAYDRAYRERNREKILERRRQIRLENLEERRRYNAEWMREWRAQNGEKSREAARDYYRRNAEERRAYQIQYRQENRERVEAQYAVHDAIHLGKLKPAANYQCIRCGDQAAEYHHWSYEREHWLNVEPMCPTCHARADRERVAIEQESDNNDHQA